MKTRRAAFRWLVMIVVVAWVAAAGAIPRAGAKEGHEVPFLVRPDGAAGELVAYDPTDGGVRHRLPPGMLAADQQRFVAARIARGETVLEWFDPASGALQRREAYPGAWTVSGVSPTGRWVAMTRVPDAAEEQARRTGAGFSTEIQIVETGFGAVTETIRLDGNFAVETISAAGDALFLVQHLPAANPDHYLIRLYHLAGAGLDPHVLRSKLATDEVMAGYAWDGVGTADGQFLLTLYLSTGRNVAFIHSLDLVNRYPVCIDLPSGNGEMDTLKQYTLALSPDGRTVYAANPALGVVAEVDLLERVVRRAAWFDPSAPDQRTKDATGPVSRAAVAADGATLFVASGAQTWVYDTQSAIVTGTFAAGGRVVGLGPSDDGRRLLIARADGPVVAVDVGSGGMVALGG